MSDVLAAGSVQLRTLPAGHVATITPGASGQVIVQRTRGNIQIGLTSRLSSAMGYGPYNFDIAIRLSALDTDAVYHDEEAAIETATTDSVAAPYAATVSHSPGATENDCKPIGWDASATRRVLITPASGGSIITGFDSVGAKDGDAAKFVRNQSATDMLKIAHLDGGSQVTNQVSCPGAGEFDVPKFAGFFLIRVGNIWTIG